jgi:transcriptional regulator with XRE-family HTH domain
MTLYDVHRRSRGRFKPSSLGGYERGERSISLERFCGLAAIYGVPAERLLAEILVRLSPEGRRELTININRLSLVGGEVARLVSELVHKVRAQRGDYMSEVITLRSGDLEALGMAAHLRPRAVITSLRPALVQPKDER